MITPLLQTLFGHPIHSVLPFIDSPGSTRPPFGVRVFGEVDNPWFAIHRGPTCAYMHCNDYLGHVSRNVFHWPVASSKPASKHGSLPPLLLMLVRRVWIRFPRSLLSSVLLHSLLINSRRCFYGGLTMLLRPTVRSIGSPNPSPLLVPLP